MFYIVGRLENFVYVFDDTDNSCELVKEIDLRKSGVVCEEKRMIPMNIEKLHVSYGLQRTDSGLNKFIVGYNIPIRCENNSSDTVRVYLNMTFALKRDLRNHADIGIFEAAGWNTDYVVFLSITVVGTGHIYSLKIPFNSPLSHITTVNNSVSGLILCPAMLVYIMDLKNQMDFKKLDSALYNIATSKLVLIDAASRIVYMMRNSDDACVSDIIWED